MMIPFVNRLHCKLVTPWRRISPGWYHLWRWYCVYCTFCKAHPAHALIKDKSAIGWFGEPAKGFAWERVKSHILSEEHKACKGYATKSTASSIKQSLEKAALQKNIITGNSKTAQVQRIINTIHLIAMRDLPDDILKDLICLQKITNGAAMG